MTHYFLGNKTARQEIKASDLYFQTLLETGVTHGNDDHVEMNPFISS